MLVTRVITAVVLLALFIPIIFFAPLDIFSGCIVFVLFFAAWEWSRLLKIKQSFALIFAILFSVWMIFLIKTNVSKSELYTLVKVASIFWLSMVPYILFRKPILYQGVWRLFLLLAAWVSLTAAWIGLCWAREQGVWFVVSILLLVWVADSMAYFTGRLIGRHKLAAYISPGKTWEGLFGGVCAVLILASTLIIFVHQTNFFSSLQLSYGTFKTFALLVILVVYSVIGDLFESLMKRQAGKKDSSLLLPGHGGVLDRVDALLPVIPLAMFFLY